MDRFNYALKPITREKANRTQKGKKKNTKIIFKDQRVTSTSYVKSPVKLNILIIVYICISKYCLGK
jgi:hypothetical protein